MDTFDRLEKIRLMYTLSFADSPRDANATLALNEWVFMNEERQSFELQRSNQGRQQPTKKWIATCGPYWSDSDDPTLAVSMLEAQVVEQATKYIDGAFSRAGEMKAKADELRKRLDMARGKTGA